MFPYWILFSIFAFGALGSDTGWRREKPMLQLLLAGFAMFLFIGLRWEVGADWIPYEFMYAEISQFGFRTALEITEPSYGILNWISSEIGLGVWAVNLVCSLFFVWGLVRFAQLQPNPWLAIVVAIPFLVIVVAMGYTRQGAAIGVAMLGLVVLHRGQIRYCFLLLLVAGTFHLSAFILIPVVGLSFTKNRAQAIILTISASIFVYLFLLDSVIGRYSSTYVEQVYQSDGAGVRLAMNIAPALLVLLFSNRLHLEDAEKRLWMNFSILGLLLNILNLFIESNTALDRIGIYIIPLQIMALSRLPGIYKNNSKENEESKVLILLIIFYAATMQFVWINYAANSEFWLPYRTILGS